MEKLNMESKDLVQEKMEKIAELFPGAITETEDEEGNLIQVVDFDLLKQELSYQVIEGEKERYQLTWPGKKEAMALASLPINKTLRPVEEESVDWESTENVYIEGDNLEALKILQESYLNSVKCIYIDPPYNTGNNFIYRDSFKQDKDEYMNDSGQVDDNGNRLFQNNESNGRFHSDWLSMMYSRLKLARNILEEDGVIFISIDDVEFDNLKKICDEIYGKHNYIGTFVWRRKVGAGADSKLFFKQHEYIILFSKNRDKILQLIQPLTDSQKKEYSNPDNDPRGDWAPTDLSAPAHDSDPKRIYEVKSPSGKVFKKCWAYTFENMKKLIDDDLVWFGPSGNSMPKRKRYLKEKKGLTVRSWIDTFLTSDGKKDLDKLDIKKYFDYPKPVNLIKHFLTIATDNKSTVMDFLAGSATTAHAVMQLNAEDGGNRKYIMVQLPEPCPEDSEAYKAGYQNISEIGKERIRRAGQKIKEETSAEIDYGFRVFKVDSSNMKEVYYRPEELTQQQILETVSNIKEDRTAEDLLFQVMLVWGLGLSLTVETKEIQGKDVHFVAGNSLVACFEEDVSEELVKEIAGVKPLRAVFRDSSFASDAERINLEEIFKMLSSGTEIKVI